MTADGYNVDTDELEEHAGRVREQVGSKVDAAHEAAQYEPGVTEMGILGFVITQIIDMKNDTDRMIMLAKNFGDELADSVEEAKRSYEDLEEGHVELLNEIDLIEAKEERDNNNPREGLPPAR